MGLDWLDIRYRLERRFDVKIGDADLAHLRGRGRADVAAGELFEVVCDRIVATSAHTARQYFTPGGE